MKQNTIPLLLLTAFLICCGIYISLNYRLTAIYRAVNLEDETTVIISGERGYEPNDFIWIDGQMTINPSYPNGMKAMIIERIDIVLK